MTEYYEVDVNGDGQTDAVEVHERPDGSSDAYVDTDRDGVTDFVLDYGPDGELDGTFNVHTGEYEFSDAVEAKVNMARTWADLPPVDENET
jgi:hypothetical protein